MKKKTNLIRRGLILDPDHPGYKDACWTITFGPSLNYKTQPEENKEEDEDILEGDVIQFTIPNKGQDSQDEKEKE